jgi:hypothetical protein
VINSRRIRMPNRPALVRRLADLRRCYTGETHSSVLPAISQGGQPLGIAERALLLEALDQGYEAQMFGKGCAPVPQAVRQAIFPEASSAEQCELEAAILAAAGRVVNYLHLRPPADLSRQAGVFRMVRPQQVELVLHLEPTVVGPLLLELIPQVTSDGVRGVPGLRARVHRRHIELFLLDTDPRATVLLSNISYRQWNAAIAFVEAAAPDVEQMRWIGDDVAPLTTPERIALAQEHRHQGPAGLMSAVLRRSAMFSAAPWYMVGARDCGTLMIEWPTGVSVAEIAAKLLHPIFGLPGEALRVLHPDEDLFVITDLAGSCCPKHVRSGVPTLLLRRSCGPCGGVGPGMRDVSAAWSAWESALAATNPMVVGVTRCQLVK